MKKILILLFSIFNLFNVNLYGYESKSIKNILDLSKFKYNYKSESYYMDEFILVEEDKDYTLIMDSEFIDGKNNEKIIFDWGENKEEYILSKMSFMSYIQFKTKSDKLKISNLRFSGMKNTNIMLYKGDINLFTGIYYPYIGKNEKEFGWLEVDIEKGETISEISKLIKALNPKNGQYLNVDLKEHNYKNELGSYYAIYETRINNVPSIFQLNIDVKDFLAPIIKTTKLEYAYHLRPQIDDLIKEIEIYDNVDQIKKENINILNENYTNASIPGEYMIEIAASDNSGNKSEKIIKINLYDGKAPEILGPSALFVYVGDAISEKEIISKYKFVDDFDKEHELEKIINRNEYKESQIPGKYNIEILAKDKSGNKSIKTIVIHVIDNIKAKFVLDERIKTTKSKYVENDKIEKVLKKALKNKNIDIINMNKEIYDLNYDQVGSYPVFINYKDDVEKEVTLFIDVENNNLKHIYIFIGLGLTTIIIGSIIYLKRK